MSARRIEILNPDPTKMEIRLATRFFRYGDRIREKLAGLLAHRRVMTGREVIEWAIKVNCEDCAKGVPRFEYVPGTDEAGAGIVHLLHAPNRQCWSQSLIAALNAHDSATAVRGLRA